MFNNSSRDGTGRGGEGGAGAGGVKLVGREGRFGEVLVRSRGWNEYRVSLWLWFRSVDPAWGGEEELDQEKLDWKDCCLSFSCARCVCEV